MRRLLLRAVSAAPLVVLLLTARCTDATGVVRGGQPLIASNDDGGTTTFTSLYADFFGPSGQASCTAQSICHVSPTTTGAQTSGFNCGSSKEACWELMTMGINPYLTGTCTPAGGKLVCARGVCNGSTCGSPGSTTSCKTDGACTSGWCNESAAGADGGVAPSCAPKLGDGVAIPKDPPHTSPTLDGTCTAAAAALVCLSGVCDPKDNACGYADGDGPCTSSGATAVCRSGACTAAGVCAPAAACAISADCPAGNWCDESKGTCLPALGDGVTIPNLVGVFCPIVCISADAGGAGCPQNMSFACPSDPTQQSLYADLHKTSGGGLNNMPCGGNLVECPASGSTYTFTSDDLARISTWIQQGAQDN